MYRLEAIGGRPVLYHSACHVHRRSIGIIQRHTLSLYMVCRLPCGISNCEKYCSTVQTLVIPVPSQSSTSQVSSPYSLLRYCGVHAIWELSRTSVTTMGLLLAQIDLKSSESRSSFFRILIGCPPRMPGLSGGMWDFVECWTLTSRCALMSEMSLCSSSTENRETGTQLS